MFKWFQKYSIEVNIPFEKVWDFSINPNNWPKWIDQIESCEAENELKSGSIVKAKIKDQAMHLSILITDLQPLNSCATLIKNPLFTQTSSCAFQKISNEKTKITLTVCVTSIFVPFMKKFFSKRFETSNKKCLAALLENSK